MCVCGLCDFCRNLPRHQFGNLQSKMFPAYFSMVGVCCAASVACFGYTHPWKSATSGEKYQLGFLVSAFAFNIINLFVFTPMTIEVNHCLYNCLRSLLHYVCDIQVSVNTILSL